MQRSRIPAAGLIYSHAHAQMQLIRLPIDRLRVCGRFCARTDISMFYFSLFWQSFTHEILMGEGSIFRFHHTPRVEMVSRRLSGSAFGRYIQRAGRILTPSRPCASSAVCYATITCCGFRAAPHSVMPDDRPHQRSPPSRVCLPEQAF